MNERIKELKLQAVLFAQDKCNGRTHDASYILRSDIMTEKFAELIVRECAKFAEQYIDERCNRDYCVGVAVQRHFGVE